MNRCQSLLLVVFISLSSGFGCPTLADATGLSTETERFPIVTRYEVARNYGYFIGDEIALNLVIETARGVVLDLVNFPKKGEKHGLFEIRDVHLSRIRQPEGGTMYRAAYVLQYFGATPITAFFEPLEILYALSEERAATSQTYRYKSLLTQRMPLSLARIGPYGPTPALEMKGPAVDTRPALVWGSASLGIVLLLISVGIGSRQWYVSRKYARSSRRTVLSPAAATLETLRQEGVALRPISDTAFPGVERLQELIRLYIHQAYGISAKSLTTREMTALLHDKALGKDILDILDRCDALKYEPPSHSQEDVRQLWWETMTVFEKLQKTDIV
jgi:hypothetical protein